jgi:hypothetical protein
MLSLGSIAGAIALIPGGGSAVAAIAKALGYLLRCGTCLKIIAVLIAIAWTALHVHHVDAAHCEERIADDHTRAAAAAAQRDKDVAKKLGDFYAPKLDALHQQNKLLQDKVSQYAKRKAPPAAGKDSKNSGRCRLGDAAGLMRPAAR